MLSIFDGRLRFGFPRNDSPAANHETGKKWRALLQNIQVPVQVTVPIDSAMDALLILKILSHTMLRRKIIASRCRPGR